MLVREVQELLPILLELTVCMSDGTPPCRIGTIGHGAIPVVLNLVMSRGSKT